MLTTEAVISETPERKSGQLMDPTGYGGQGMDY
jgi:hypothetical protein